MPGKTIENKGRTMVFTIVMWILALLMVMPFVMMVIISFRTQGEAYEPIFAPFTPILRNYEQVLGHENFIDWYTNTFETVLITIAIRLLVTLPAAYSFSRIGYADGAGRDDDGAEVPLLQQHPSPRQHVGHNPP